MKLISDKFNKEITIDNADTKWFSAKKKQKEKNTHANFESIRFNEIN